MKVNFRILLLTVAFLFTSLIMVGQNSSSDTNNPSLQNVENSLDNPSPEPSESKETFALPLSRLEFQLSLCILIFGLVLILLEIYLVRNKNIGAEDTIKFVVITIIIVSTLFLITAGYSNDQIAPAVGLLGTIAGYLLGRINTPNKNNNEKT